MKYLGVDFGDARTGLAVSDAGGLLASPLPHIAQTSLTKTAKVISDTAATVGAKAIVLGFPKNMNGTLGARAEKTKVLEELLTKEYSLEVILRDERLTTVSAGRYFTEMGVRGKKRKENIDSMSACIILQDYLDSIR